MKPTFKMGYKLYQGNFLSAMVMLVYNQVLEFSKKVNCSNYSSSILLEKIRLDNKPFVNCSLNDIDGNITLNFIDAVPEVFIFDSKHHLPENNIWHKAVKLMLTGA